MRVDGEEPDGTTSPEAEFPADVLTATLRALGEAILCTDARGRITYANEAAEKLLDRPAESFRGQLVREVLPLLSLDGGPLTMDFIEQIQQTHEAVRFDASLQGVGRKHSVACTVAPVLHGRQDLGLVFALRDVTELLETRQQLEFSERLAALGTLAAGVAHEVNNPLAVVLSSVGYCLKSGSLDPTVVEALIDARDAATRAAFVIDALRDFSHAQVEALRPFDPRAVFGTVLHLTHAQWRTNAGVSLELGAVPQVMAVPSRLAQVVVTLVINAVQSMEALGGDRLITLSSHTDARGWAVISVIDEGPGLSPQVARRIFDPFFTTRPPGSGTGLGLSIARTIVENHRGELIVEPTRSGVGSCFSVRLPPSTEQGPPGTPLELWWVGPATPESEKLCPGKQLDVSGDLSPTIGADLLLLNVSVSGLSVLHARHPDLDFRGLLVNQRPPPGLRAVSTRNLDPEGLVAYVRRGR
jgi:PAS domain S-box-containing protein